MTTETIHREHRRSRAAALPRRAILRDSIVPLIVEPVRAAQFERRLARRTIRRSAVHRKQR
jgi:hypothetical protein